MNRLAPYPSLDAIEHSLKGAQESHPDLCRTISIGKSLAGRDIWAIQVGRNPKAPVFSLTGLFHSMEFPSTLMVMRFLEHALQDHKNPLLDSTSVCLVPVVNPDGYQGVWDKVSSGKKWFFDRYNGNDVNLNRNFGAGFENRRKRSPKSGEAPFSEPESQALMRWHHAHPPRVSFALHTCGHYLVYPWAFHHGPPVDEKTFLRLAKIFNQDSPKPYKVIQGSHFNGHTGDYQDWVYQEFKAASFLIEMGRPPVSVNVFNLALDPFTFFNYPHPKGLHKDIENTLKCLDRVWRITPDLPPLTVEEYPTEVDYRTTLFV